MHVGHDGAPASLLHDLSLVSLVMNLSIINFVCNVPPELIVQACDMVRSGLVLRS